MKDPAGAPLFAIGDILEPYATIKPTRLQRSHLMNDFGSIRDAVSRVAPRYAIAKVAVFSLYASDQARTGGDACLLLDVGCTFSRADAAQFRRFIAEDLGCTVDVVFRSALTAEDFARAETEARVVYENPDVTIASTPDTRAQAAPPAARPLAPICAAFPQFSQKKAARHALSLSWNPTHTRIAARERTTSI